MNQTQQYRPMKPGEETKVCTFVARVFDEFIAPHYSEEGCQEFLKYIRPADLRHRSQTNHFVLLALNGQEIVGMIEVRDDDHVSLLFVEGRLHGQGIGRQLLRHALEICKKNRPELEEISVNASPNSFPIYQKMGFRPCGYERVKNGVRYTPMVLELKDKLS